MNKNAAQARARRRALVLEIVEDREIHTQEQLVTELQRRGIRATQASVSRDIAELGLGKVAGRYHAGATPVAADPALPLRTWVHHVAAAGPNLVVLRCDAGCAQPVGVALDEMAHPGVVGTIAGDDTVFVALASTRSTKRLVHFLGTQLRQREE